MKFDEMNKMIDNLKTRAEKAEKQNADLVEQGKVDSAKLVQFEKESVQNRKMLAEHKKRDDERRAKATQADSAETSVKAVDTGAPPPLIDVTQQNGGLNVTQPQGGLNATHNIPHTAGVSILTSTNNTRGANNSTP
ncbi:MAG: hypothetical protein GY820_47830, partial [Gammaproteobacteria bacterium]|nr:hypothetical protein [Gammaproteobacteria bacterium]